MMDLSVTPASLVSSVYEKLTENINSLRARTDAPLTLAEKLVFGHATDISSISVNKGEEYGDFAPYQSGTESTLRFPTRRRLRGAKGTGCDRG